MLVYKCTVWSYCLSCIYSFCLFSIIILTNLDFSLLTVEKNSCLQIWHGQHSIVCDQKGSELRIKRKTFFFTEGAAVFLIDRLLFFWAITVHQKLRKPKLRNSSVFFIPKTVWNPDIFNNRRLRKSANMNVDSVNFAYFTWSILKFYKMLLCEWDKTDFFTHLPDNSKLD